MDLSIVVPCLNEEKNIPLLVKELSSFLPTTKKSFEIILVNDGSKDGTWEEIKKAAFQHKFVKGINHMRNFGQTAAYQSGFDISSGNYVVVISSDNETPVSRIGDVISRLDEGYDFVNTNRVGRYKKNAGVSMVKRIPSLLANKLINKLSNINIKDTGSGLKGMKRFLVDNIRLYGDMHRYLPSIASMYGARIIEIDCEYIERTYGASKYGKVGLSRTFKVFLDLIAVKFLTSFSTKPFTMMPIRFFGGTGVIFSSVGMFFGLILTFEKLFFGQNIGSRPLLLLAVLLIIVGFQFIMMGLLGELMLRTYYESSGKKTYTIRETI